MYLRFILVILVLHMIWSPFFWKVQADYVCVNVLLYMEYKPPLISRGSDCFVKLLNRLIIDSNEEEMKQDFYSHRSHDFFK